MTRLLGRLERYVMTQTLVAVAGALGIIGFVIVLIDFVELSRDIGSNTDANFFSVLGLTLMKSPNDILLVMPFVFLLGVQFAFAQLNRRSELVAMRAAGVSAWRFIFPAAAAAFLIGVLTVTVISPIASVLSDRYAAARAGSSQETKPEEIWLRQGDGRTQAVIRAARRDGAVLRDVSMFIYDVRQGQKPVFVRRIEAREARLERGRWRLAGVREAAPGEVAVASQAVDVSSTLDPEAALGVRQPADAIPFWGLFGEIGQAQQAGLSPTPYEMRLQQLLATPLTYAAMALLAAGFSLRLLRLGGLAQLAGAGILLGFVFFFITQLCIALGKSGVLTPALAAWMPPLLAVLAGFTLLLNTEDG